jgi:3-hydroxyisobutyrate dehydrogenase-like beta-hydroxyacid dehydrogenase
MVIGLLHPGEMGAAVGAALRAGGHAVLWASAGRSGATAERADRSGLEDAGTVEELARRCDVLLSVCPPHAAVEVSRPLGGFAGIYVDANAVSPETARAIARHVGRYVDGGIIGPPPSDAGTTRLYLSGGEAETVAALFEGTIVDARAVSEEVGAASAVKIAYAAWTKGSSALLLAVRALARAEGVERPLLDEWRESLPQLHDRSVAAGRSAVTKGWRWVGEMNEIADTFSGAGLPDGFHRAAAEVYRRSPHGTGDGDVVDLVLSALGGAPRAAAPTEQDRS